MTHNTATHHFTVVIPTRERCDTLEHALRTCVIQDYDNLEIIVSDNLSQDRTREVVASCKDPRIRYINTGKRLSMSGNYEFALSHVRPEGYVIYIGDDDGLLPNAIRNINAAIVETGAQVLRWDVASYAWPTIEGDGANRLVIPSLGSGTARCDSAATIQNVLSFHAPYQSLPLLYMYSAVAYDVIRRIRDSSGRFYHSVTPDVYSGFAIAASVDSFVHSKRLYAIAGRSHHSIGASQFACVSPEPAQEYYGENDLPIHSSMLVSESLHACIIESFLQARDHLPSLDKVTVDMQQLLFKMMEETRGRPQDTYMEIKDVVCRLGQMHKIPEAAQRAIDANPWKGPGAGRKLTVGNIARAGLQMMRLFAEDLRKCSFYLDCSRLSVSNVYDAAILCDHVLRLMDVKVLGFSTVVRSSLTNIKRMIAP